MWLRRSAGPPWETLSNKSSRQSKQNRFLFLEYLASLWGFAQKHPFQPSGVTNTVGVVGTKMTNFSIGLGSCVMWAECQMRRTNWGNGHISDVTNRREHEQQPPQPKWVDVWSSNLDASVDWMIWSSESVRKQMYLELDKTEILRDVPAHEVLWKISMPPQAECLEGSKRSVRESQQSAMKPDIEGIKERNDHPRYQSNLSESRQFSESRQHVLQKRHTFCLGQIY